MRFVLAIALAGCAGELSQTGDDVPDPPPPPVCETTRSYAGFGGPLEGDRPSLEAGTDRLRAKPFAVLASEYDRALGLAGFSTQAYAATFGRPPARWFTEPDASANTIYAAFALAYEACSQHTAAPPEYASAPTVALADMACRTFARSAWQRDATDDEVAACTSYAVDQTNPADDPRVRWAYACAAVLTATGFLTY